MNVKSTALASVALAASLMWSAVAVAQETAEKKQCHWWQFGHCDRPAITGLPYEAPSEGTIITVDVSTHTAYLFQDGELVGRSPAATGSEKLLKRGRRIWLFHTPRGRLKVLRKIVDPVWRKPDWAYIEAGEAVPPPDSPRRMVKGHLGKYALDLGDGIMIHGTDDLDSLGKPASHGCIRLPDQFLSTLWKETKVGTDVYIFESKPPVKTASTKERHSDLE